LPLDSEAHRVQAERFESFLSLLDKTAAAGPYQEWRVVAAYYTTLHYIDAFLTSHSLKNWDRHDDRLRRMEQFAETRAIKAAYHQLQKLSREARYDGTPFIAADYDRNVRPLYDAVRSAMRSALRLPL
jgi:hypothetical protein